MAVQFLVDSVQQPRDPSDTQWEPKEVLARNHSFAPIFNIKRIARLILDNVSTADYATFLAHDDGETHTVTIERPEGGMYTQYSDVYLIVTNSGLRDINAYDVEIEISGIEI